MISFDFNPPFTQHRLSRSDSPSSGFRRNQGNLETPRSFYHLVWFSKSSLLDNHLALTFYEVASFPSPASLAHNLLILGTCRRWYDPLRSSAFSCCRSAAGVVEDEALIEELRPVCLNPVQVFVLQPMTAVSVPEHVRAFDLERPLAVDKGCLAHLDVSIAQPQDWTALVVGSFIVEIASLGVIDL